MTIMGSRETEDREYRPFEKIRDNYPKYLVTRSNLIQRRDGVKHVNIGPFMKDNRLFDWKISRKCQESFQREKMPGVFEIVMNELISQPCGIRNGFCRFFFVANIDFLIKSKITSSTFTTWHDVIHKIYYPYGGLVMAKMGRPRSENPKQNILTLRVTNQERDEIQAYARLHKISVAQTLLDAFRLMVQREHQDSWGTRVGKLNWFLTFWIFLER